MPKSSSGSSITAVSSSSVASPGPSSPTKSSKVDPSKLFGRVQELIDTERSYVKRIDVLHQKYAVPLRDLAKDRTAAIIPLYEAQRLFGNIGEIAGANRAFLNDLERLVLQGHDALRAGLGEVIYNHMSCFSCYTDYFANFEKAKHIERTLAKHRAFCEFTDRTKYSVTDIGNTGLRDLMMEPVQRIPRYKLLIDAILKHVEQGDPLRKRLEQAISLVSRIASCEADEKTRRAAILWSFSRNIEAFPAELISAHRRFIDCIDVDDYPLDTSAGSSSIAASFSGIKSIPCTLFLFDDRIAIVKRSHASTSGRKLVGLDDVGRLISQMKTVTEKSSTGSILAPSKRSELSFRGCISLTDVEAQDLGGADLQLAMLRQPSHVTGDKWSNRPLRQYVAVDTSASAPGTHGSRIQMGSSSLDADVSAKLEKMRFLESVWKAKALYKAVRSRSEVRCTIVPASRRGARSNDILIGAPQPSLSLRDSRKVIYFQLHSRQSYADESHRAPVAVSVDPPGISDRVELGHTDLSHPHAILDISQVDEMEEEFVATVRTKSAHGGGEVLGEPHALSSADLADHIVQLSDEVEKRFGSSDDGAPLVARRRASGTKRPLSSYDGDVAGNGGEGSLKKRPSHGLDKESKEIRLLPHKRPSVEEPGRSSISESEASTEQGHSKAPSQSVPPVAPARTSSTVTKAQESRRRNEAMEFGLRLVKEELNLLRCDVEILQSSLTAIENSRTPRKRPDSTVLADRDLNTTAVNREVTQIHARLQKLESLFTDVDARWISSIRMHNRIVHDLNVATTALASQAPTTTPAHEDALRSEKSKLEHQLSALKRQCELLTTLEADGRLENTEMHKAFNEELDLLYDHTQAPESIELAALRKELKRTKAAQHELMVENKRLKRDLTLEQGQTQTYKAALERHALL
uniref:DH domain-containing protein n=1 Tax=Kalmanozyma brasiliensis (strain GHG001) TaxID=1365824 RepID=V5ESS8_KALBG